MLYNNRMKNKEAINQLEQELQKIIEQLEPIEEDTRGRGRPRILPSMCLWVGYLVCVLRGMSSQLSIWRIITEKGLWYYPRFSISDQAVYKRLEKEGTKPLEKLYKNIRKILEERLEPYSKKNCPICKKSSSY